MVQMSIGVQLIMAVCTAEMQRAGFSLKTQTTCYEKRSGGRNREKEREKKKRN